MNAQKEHLSRSLPQLALMASPYVAYTYSYPHKSAYRSIWPGRRLKELWAAEKSDSLFLYLHVPFCEMRCGFCNLFTTANPRDQITDNYLDVIWRQARRVADAIGPRHFARMAVGGGTPTYLTARQLDRLMRIATDIYRIVPGSIPISVETSPRTADRDLLGVLKSFGVSRISIGVQSFVETEVAAAARAQKNAWVQAALQRIRDLAFPVLNIDLIYGLPQQTVETWLDSLRAALRWNPEELYLYPLYVRPLTALDRHGCRAHDQLRLDCYRASREMLLTEGYEQVSMRMFRRRGAAADAEPVYCCQQDGMLGIGCGARSYTRSLHYSTEYAVASQSVREIINDYLQRPDESFDLADYGCELDDSEQRRRWIIKSLFRANGCAPADYFSIFGTSAVDDFPELSSLADAGYLELETHCIRPTPLGLEWSDALGPMLISPQVRDMMAEFEVR